MPINAVQILTSTVAFGISDAGTVTGYLSFCCVFSTKSTKKHLSLTVSRCRSWRICMSSCRRARPLARCPWRSCAAQLFITASGCRLPGAWPSCRYRILSGPSSIPRLIWRTSSSSISLSVAESIELSRTSSSWEEGPSSSRDPEVVKPVLWIRNKSFRIRIRAALIQNEFETKFLW